MKLPKSEWILRPRAFEPVIDHATFLKAQQVLSYRTTNLSDEDLLDRLRLLFSREGRLSLRLIKNSSDIPSPSTYRHRFGSLRNAYQMIGYGHPEQFGPIDLRRRTQALREELFATIAETFPHDVSIVRNGGRWRTKLRLGSGTIVSVLVARSVKVWKNTVRWIVDPIEHERDYVTLLARLDGENRVFLDFHVLPNVDRSTRLQISWADQWLLRGLRLNKIAGLLGTIQQLSRRGIDC